jgi:hypothetical protein
VVAVEVASGIVVASLVADRDRVVAIVVEASLVQLAAAVDIVCTVDSLVVCIVVVVGLIVAEASLVVTAVEDSSVADNIVGVASLVDRLAVVAAVVAMGHSTTLIYSSLSSMSMARILMYFIIQRLMLKMLLFVRKKPSASMDFPSFPCKGTIAIQTYNQFYMNSQLFI